MFCPLSFSFLGIKICQRNYVGDSQIIREIERHLTIIKYCWLQWRAYVCFLGYEGIFNFEKHKKDVLFHADNMFFIEKITIYLVLIFQLPPFSAYTSGAFFFSTTNLSIKDLLFKSRFYNRLLRWLRNLIEIVIGYNFFIVTN